MESQTKILPVLVTIDPGVSGAIAVTHGKKTVVRDLPVSKETFIPSQSKCLHVVAFDNLLMEMIGKPAVGTPIVFATEQMQSLGSRTPSRTLLGLAEMAGSLETAVRLFCLYGDYPLFLRRYQPRQWISWMFPESEARSSRDQKETKEESLNMARRLFPKNKEDLMRKKDHNRAEALLLALVSIAELSGLQIGAALTTIRKLQPVYHRQHAMTHEADFSAVFGAWDFVAPALRQEVQNRKKYQLCMKEVLI